jgi:hypothetical protein
MCVHHIFLGFVANTSFIFQHLDSIWHKLPVPGCCYPYISYDTCLWQVLSALVVYYQSLASSTSNCLCYVYLTGVTFTCQVLATCIRRVLYMYLAGVTFYPSSSTCIWQVFYLCLANAANIC